MNRWWLLVVGFAILLMVHVVLTVRQIDQLELDTARLAAGAAGEGESAGTAASLEFHKGVSEFDDWLDRPLFWRDRRPVEVSEPEGPPVQRANLGNVRLAGIVGTRDAPVALLLYEGTHLRLRHGDSVTPGWTLDEILSESVVIRSEDGQSTTLRLFEAIGGPQALPAQTAEAAAQTGTMHQGEEGEEGQPPRPPLARPGTAGPQLKKQPLFRNVHAPEEENTAVRRAPPVASGEEPDKEELEDAGEDVGRTVASPSPQTQESGRED